MHWKEKHSCWDERRDARLSGLSKHSHRLKGTFERQRQYSNQTLECPFNTVRFPVDVIAIGRGSNHAVKSGHKYFSALDRLKALILYL